MLATSAGHCSTPKPGFVTVIGSAAPGVSHSDRGAPPQMQGIALKNSGAQLAYCNIPSDSALNPLLASGCEVAAYTYINQSETQWYYNKGVRHFIFGNEPDGSWPSYGDLLRQAYPMFASLLPGSKVIAPNCFGLSPYDGLYASYNLKNSCDMIGFHNYSDDSSNGLSIGAVVSLHGIMESYGDGARKIYLGEGWGPKRELRTCPRISPDLPPTLLEIQQMRDFVINGWHNLNNAIGGYDPNWVYGALFFTLSDNWGFDYSHFYNGGLIDLCDNPKDDLLLVFPGNRLTVRNCGFEYNEPGKPQGAAPFWLYRNGTTPSCYGLDGSIRHGGVRSQRIEISGTTEAYIVQPSEVGSVTPGQVYTFSAWVRTDSVNQGPYSGARLGMEFYNSSGARTSDTIWSSGISGDSDWALVTVTATAPANSSLLTITCDLAAISGRAWFDDCAVSPAATPQTGNIEGYVLNSGNNAISGAHVTVDPGGASANTDSTGHFTLTGILGGACSVSAAKSGYGRTNVSRIAVAPGRTSVAGLSLPAVSPSSPSGVRITSTGVSGVLRISWEAPSGGADYYRVYRSTSSGSLGTLVFDNVTALSVWDDGLTDYQKYYYTVRRVLGDVESSNSDRYSGIPTGGSTSVCYDNNASPNWSNWSTDHGQTFVATKTGSIVSATCVLATSGSPNSRTMTFSILDGGPTGAQIGPSKAVTCYSDEIGTAIWSAADVPVVEGHTYYLKLVASSGTAIYRSDQDVYANGRYYKDGQPYSPSSDLWSTISIAEAGAPDVINITASNTGPGEVTVTWETTAPTTSRVDYGATASYGASSPADSALTSEHTAVLSGLAAGEYHFRAAGSRPASPEAVSLDYTFDVPAGFASVAAAKTRANGASVGFPGVVSALFGGFLYVQDEAGVSGIRVEAGAAGLAVGDGVYVTGKLATNADGERCLTAAAVSPSFQISGAGVAPLTLTNRSLGGGSTANQDGVWSWQWARNAEDKWEYKWLPMPGLNNIGLLIQTCGRVTRVGPLSGLFCIDDGSGLCNHARTSTGVRVALDPADRVLGQLLSVTGIVSCVRDTTGDLLPLIRARNEDDVREVQTQVANARL